MTARLFTSEAGDREQVRERHARGQLVRVRRGRYAAAGQGADQMPAELAARAATDRLDAVASHHTAAALWGLPVLGRPDPQVHVTRTRRKQGTLRGYPGVVLHHATVPPDHVTERHGVPVTTPARTVLDLARSQPFRAGVVVADAVLRRLCQPEELLAVATACRGWPGTRRARRVVGFADPRAETPLESISRVAFHQYGLPPAVLQAVIGGYERADFLWPDYRVIGEAGGRGKYTDAEVLWREKVQEDNLVELGFTVVRWTWRDAYRRPDALAHRCLTTLVRRGYRLVG